jgi:hypothetical protein
LAGSWRTPPRCLPNCTPPPASHQSAAPPNSQPKTRPTGTVKLKEQLADADAEAARAARVRARGFGLRVPAAPRVSSRVSPPHRPRENGLAHPADPSRPNIAFALGLLSRWRPFPFLACAAPLPLLEEELAHERQRAQQQCQRHEQRRVAQQTHGRRRRQHPPSGAVTAATSVGAAGRAVRRGRAGGR